MKTSLFLCPCDSSLAEEQRESHFLPVCNLPVICLLSVYLSSACRLSSVHLCVIRLLSVCLLSIYLSSACRLSVFYPSIYHPPVVCLLSIYLSSACHLSVFCPSIYHPPVVCLSSVHLSVILPVISASLLFSCSVQLFETPRNAARQASCPSLSPGVCSNSCQLSQ